MQIQPISDTQVIDETTRDTMRVDLVPEPEIITDAVTLPDGSKYEGGKMTKPPVVTNLGEMQARIDFLTENMAKEQVELDTLNAQLPEVATAVDTMIAEKVKNGAEDRRAVDTLPVEKIIP